jgi:hypothetical protein
MLAVLAQSNAEDAMQPNYACMLLVIVDILTL